MDWKKLLCEKRQCNQSNKNNKNNKKNNNDMRNEFQKDYHRIIGSASFRRLQDKTQVFPLDKSDFVRTRLTHSLGKDCFCFFVYERFNLLGCHLVDISCNNSERLKISKQINCSAKKTCACDYFVT